MVFPCGWASQLASFGGLLEAQKSEYHVRFHFFGIRNGDLASPLENLFFYNFDIFAGQKGIPAMPE